MRNLVHRLIYFQSLPFLTVETPSTEPALCIGWADESGFMAILEMVAQMIVAPRLELMSTYSYYAY
jgi:hypothetical protein